MEIKFEKLDGSRLKRHEEYYFIYCDSDAEPIAHLDNMAGKWNLRINYRDNLDQIGLALGKTSEWPFEELKEPLLQLIESYLILTQTKKSFH